MKRALVVVLLVAACGGGSDKPSAKESYLSTAEAVCADANAALAKAKKERPTAIADVPAYVHRVVDIARTNVRALSALSAPDADAGELETKLITPLTQQLDDADAFTAKVDAAAKAKDGKALTALVFNPPTKTRVDIAWMKSYGFKACVIAADTGAASK